MYFFIQIAETADRINYAKLKTQERIYFYDEVILYEDELADNGTAVLSVKIVSTTLISHVQSHDQLLSLFLFLSCLRLRRVVI